MVLTLLPSRTRSIFASTKTLTPENPPSDSPTSPLPPRSPHPPPSHIEPLPPPQRPIPPSASRRYYRSESFQTALREAKIELERNSISTGTTGSTSSRSSGSDFMPTRRLTRADTNASMATTAGRRSLSSNASSSAGGIGGGGGASRLSRYRSMVGMRGFAAKSETHLASLVENTAQEHPPMPQEV